MSKLQFVHIRWGQEFCSEKHTRIQHFLQLKAYCNYYVLTWHYQRRKVLIHSDGLSTLEILSHARHNIVIKVT